MKLEKRVDLWDFAVGTYGQAGVGDDCLMLQDQLGVDVPLLLWAAWAEVTGYTVDTDALERAEALAAPWREEVVKPLRALRRRLKQGPPPAPSATSEALRDKVKAAELSAEKIELDSLAALALRHGTDEPADPLVALRLTAHHFAGRNLTAEEDTALTRIAAAARTVVSAPR